MDNNPTNHNGTDVFTFEIRFSEEFPPSFRTLKFHAFTVTRGTVKETQGLCTIGRQSPGKGCL